jgi:hypothetical protein
MPMLAAHAMMQGLLSRIRRICIGSIDALKELLALMTADKFFHCQHKQTTTGDVHFVRQRLDLLKERLV